MVRIWVILLIRVRGGILRFYVVWESCLVGIGRYFVGSKGRERVETGRETGRRTMYVAGNDAATINTVLCGERLTVLKWLPS